MMLNRIATNKKLKRVLDSAATLGTFNALFTKSGVVSASVNISLQDWRFLINAVKSTGGLQDSIILRDISLAKIHYAQDMSSNGRKSANFWEGLSNGCKY